MIDKNYFIDKNIRHTKVPLNYDLLCKQAETQVEFIIDQNKLVIILTGCLLGLLLLIIITIIMGKVRLQIPSVSSPNKNRPHKIQTQEKLV